jgi:polyhydroxyalkanoate synthesis regulator phasin
MTDDTENLILRLLREIRSDLGDTKGAVHRLGERMTTLDRRMVDVQESVALAVGFSVSANAHYETNAERIDRLTETVESLKARIEVLERNS